MCFAFLSKKQPARDSLIPGRGLLKVRQSHSGQIEVVFESFKKDHGPGQTDRGREKQIKDFDTDQ
jgi:hypothetical protein